MLNILLGFAAGYWVASRQAAGQPIVPDDVKAAATKAVDATTSTTPTGSVVSISSLLGARASPLPRTRLQPALSGFLIADNAGLRAGSPGDAARQYRGYRRR